MFKGMLRKQFKKGLEKLTGLFKAKVYMTSFHHCSSENHTLN